MEIGEGEGREMRAGAVSGRFFIEVGKGKDDKESWWKNVRMDKGAEPSERYIGVVGGTREEACHPWLEEKEVDPKREGDAEDSSFA